MIPLILCGSGALLLVLVTLGRTLKGDGYGVRPGPRSHDARSDTWALPHDETRRRSR